MNLLLACAVLACVLPGCREGDGAPAEDPFEARRHAMVRDQIAQRDIADERLLAAMRTVPRHELVPATVRPEAYADRPLPIGHDQTISQPYIVAFMTEALALRPGDKVLEIGTGSGYQAAVLAEMGMEVYSIEIVRPLGERVAKDLARLGYGQVKLRIGDGYQGWPEASPFDAIILTAAPPSAVPGPLFEQLAEGGRLVAPVGRGVQELVRYRKVAGKLELEKLLAVRFVPMTGKAQGGP